MTEKIFRSANGLYPLTTLTYQTSTAYYSFTFGATRVAALTTRPLKHLRSRIAPLAPSDEETPNAGCEIRRPSKHGRLLFPANPHPARWMEAIDATKLTTTKNKSCAKTAQTLTNERSVSKTIWSRRIPTPNNKLNSVS